MSVTSRPAAGDFGDTYYRGEDIWVEVEFDRLIAVTGTPELSLAFGDDERSALYREKSDQAGSGKTRLRFRYTVAEGDRASDGISIRASDAAGTVGLVGGSIKDWITSVEASRAYAGRSNLPLHKVNGNRSPHPGVSTNLTATATRSHFNLNWSAPTWTGSTPITGYKIEYSEDAGVTWKDLVDDTGSSGSSYAHNHDGKPGGTTWHFRVSAINAQGTGGSSNTTLATVPPRVSAVSITSSPAQGDTYGRDETVEVQVTFDREVTVSETPRVVLEMGTVFNFADYASGSGSKVLTFRYRVQETDSDSDGLSVISDSSGTGSITDRENGLAADRTFSNISDSPDHKVEGNNLFVPLWQLSLSSDTVREDDAEGVTATVSITNGFTFDSAQNVNLKWGDQNLVDAGLQKLGGHVFVRIPKNQSSGSRTLLPRNKDTYRPPETRPIIARHDGTEIGRQDLTRIDDEEPPAVTITASATSVSEGQPITLTVNLAGAPSVVDVPVALAMSNPDGAVSGELPSSLTIEAGQDEATLSIDTLEDNMVQGQRTVTFSVTDNKDYPSDFHYSPGTPSSATVTITDDTLVWTVTAKAGIAEASGVANLTVSTGGVTFPEDQTITLDLTGSTATAGADFRLYDAEGEILNVPYSLTLSAGASKATGTLGAISDIIVEGTEYASIKAKHDGVQIGTTKTVVIADDDVPTWSVQFVPSTVVEAGGVSTLLVSTGGVVYPDVQSIELDLTGSTATAGSDFTLADGDGTTLTAPYSLALAADSGGAVATLTAQDDDLDEDDELVTIAASRDNEAIGTTQTLTITDDEEAGVRVEPTRVTVTEGGDGATYTMVLTSLPGSEVTVTPAVTEGSDDVTVNPQTLTFTVSNWNEAQTVTVTAVDDNIDEDSETAQVSHTVSGYGSVTTAPGVDVEVSDNDSAPTAVQLSVSPSTVTEGGGEHTVTVTASLVDTARSVATDVTVSVSDDTATASDDYGAVESFTITIPGNQMSATGTFTLTPVNDSVAEGAETVRVSAAAGDLTAATADLTISDDDDAPTALALALSPESVTEAGGAQTVTVTASLVASAVSPAVAGDFTQSGTTLTIAAGATGSSGTVTITAVNNDLDAPDKEVTVSATASGGGVAAPSSKTLTIADDDDAPTPTLVIADDEGMDTPGRPGAPRSTTLSSGDGKVVMQWFPPRLTGASPIRHYEYRLDAEYLGNPWVQIPDSAPGEANHGRYEIAYRNGSYATVYLRAVNDQGAGPDEHRSAVPFAGAPGPPANFSVTLISENEFRLSWTEPVAAPGVIITGYSIDGSPDGVTDWEQSTYNITVPGTTSLTGRIGPRRGAFRIATRFQVETPAVIDGFEFSEGRSEASPVSPVVRPRNRETSVDPALPQIRVWDAFAREGHDAAVNFTVRLLPAATSTVTVDYRTEDIRATAPDDYEATSGTLTFAPGETEKTVSVPVVDDAVEDSGEEFALLLSNVSGARLGDEGAAGVIFNEEDVLGGFTLVDAASGTDVGAIEHGATMTLDDPATGSFGIVARAASDVPIGSVRLELSGAKAVARTDNAAPYTLYTEGGAALPAGGYTLSATAYAEANGGGKALQTRTVSFTVRGPAVDDENDGAAAATALTASFGAMPSEHAGPGARFVFQLTFSEEPKVGYKKLRDHAFSVTGGNVREAQRRQQGSNVGWNITVEPSEWGDIAISLPGGRACSSSGGICTADDRRLSNSPNAIVQGPAALSVADARAQEGTDATLDFAVSLSRASSQTVTVDYATSDGTATAGADYTATSGTLTFVPGDVSETVSVPVLDDAHDDGGETLTLTLSNASGARIRDGEATGTIENSDAIPKAWLARFGRTVADHVVDAVAARLEGSPGGGSQVTLGGQRIPLDGVLSGTSPGATAGSDARETAAADTLAGFADGISDQGAGAGWIGWGGPGDEDAATGPTSRTLGERELALGSAFWLSAGGDGEGDGGVGTHWTAWGRAAQSSFDGDADGLALDGDVSTFTLGADAEWTRWLAGVAVSLSEGEGGFRDRQARSDDGSRGSGTLESAVTSVHPYARFEVSERLSVWGILGYGTGEMTLEVDGAGRWRTDTEMRMAASGVSGEIVSAEDTGGFELAARGDARLVRVSSAAATSADGAGLLSATEAETSRLRFMRTGSHRFELTGGRTLTPSLELGLRNDSGDAETGTGIELGGSVRYSDPGAGLTVEAKARGLVAHENADYSEWGASGSVRIDPGASGRGLSLTLTPAWGAASGGAERLWSARDARGLATNDAFEPASRLDAEAGWGLGAYGGMATPFAGLALSDAGDRTWRTGVRWTLGPDMAFGVEGTLREAGNDNAAEHGLMLRAGMSW